MTTEFPAAKTQKLFLILEILCIIHANQINYHVWYRVFYLKLCDPLGLSVV